MSVLPPKPHTPLYRSDGTMESCCIGQKMKSGHSWTCFIPCLLLWMGLAILSSGCAVGPDVVKPDAPTAEEWMVPQTPAVKGEADKERMDDETPRMEKEPADYNEWWKVFSDPALETLVAKAHKQNLTLQIAGIRIMESRAQLGIAVGNLYPQRQAFFVEYTANRLSKNTSLPVNDRDFQSLSTGFDAAWELDLWGKYRRSVESGMANLEASIASYDDALVSLASEVARTYLVIRTLEQRLEIAQENVRIQERSLAIANARFQGGDVSELDVAQARSLLKDTEASIPALERSLRQAKNALATLLGTLPGEIDSLLEGPPRIPKVAGEVVLDVPAELLRRRPDIRLAEMRVQAQRPQIGVAKADLYPSFALAGTIGWRTTNSDGILGNENALGDIYESDSVFWAAGPTVTWNIFNYGRIRNRVRVEQARFQQLVVAYKNTVLRAHEDVENAITGFVRSREEEKFLRDSVAAAKRSVDISLLQYREGLTDFQRVLDTQRFLTTQSNRLTDVSGSVVTSLVAMYKALGGGWQIRKDTDFISPEVREEMSEETGWGGLMQSKEMEFKEPPEKWGRWRLPDW